MRQVESQSPFPSPLCWLGAGGYNFWYAVGGVGAEVAPALPGPTHLPAHRPRPTSGLVLSWCTDRSGRPDCARACLQGSTWRSKKLVSVSARHVLPAACIRWLRRPRLRRRIVYKVGKFPIIPLSGSPDIFRGQSAVVVRPTSKKPPLAELGGFAFAILLTKPTLEPRSAGGLHALLVAQDPCGILLSASR